MIDQAATVQQPHPSLEQKRKDARKAVVAASIGNGLEWFDLIVYGSFAVTISKLFFPTTNENSSLLLAFASFGVSFLMRPLGAVIIGRYSDQAGRKAGLTLSIVLMFIGTLMIATAPTAQSIGAAAAIIILVARLLQGFSAGGEFASATAFLIEYAPDRKAFYGSWQVATQGAAILLAGLFGFVLNTYLSTQSLESWGWRIPFIFALAIGPVGWYIRTKMDETPEFLAAKPSKAPLTEAFVTNRGRLWTIVGVVALCSVANYLALYMPTYAIVNLKMDGAAAFVATLVYGGVMFLCAPVVGNLADRFGPARIMTYAAIGSLIAAVPMFMLLVAFPSVLTLAGIEVIFGLLATAYFAPLPALLASVFPPQIRTTGMSLSYNIAMTIFGGFAPFILTWLIAATGSLLAPSFYMLAIAGLSVVSILLVRKKYGQA